MKNRLSIVIGSGGVLCAASLGLSKVLRREGLTPGLAVGCSGGSIYAATIALGIDPDEAQRLTLHLFTSDVFEGYTSNLKSALSSETRFRA
jgi:NTE family protein